MRKLTMFVQYQCPFCKMALQYITDLQKKDEKYNEIQLEIVDELVEVERADSYDYYYVPTFYLDDKKLHEGGIYRDEIKELFDSILNS